MLRSPLVLASLLLVKALNAPAASAEVRTIAAEDSNVCRNPHCLVTTSVPVLQGGPTKYTLIGPWTDHSATASVSGAGVTAALSNPKANFDNSSIDVTLIAQAGAAPGERTVALRNASGGSTGTFKIRVVRKGSITGVEMPSPSEAFRQVDLRVRGSNLSGSAVRVDVREVTSSAIVSNTDAEIVVRLTFASPQVSASGRMKFWDGACQSCDTVWRYSHEGGGNLGWIPIEISGPNAIKEITVVTGTATWFIANQPATVRITLLRPVAAARPTGTVASRTTAGSLSPAGMTVYWQFPESKYVKPATGQVTIPAGQSYAEFRVTPNGEILAGSSAYYQPPQLTIEARSDLHATAAPHLKTVTIPFK